MQLEKDFDLVMQYLMNQIEVALLRLSMLLIIIPEHVIIVAVSIPLIFILSSILLLILYLRQEQINLLDIMIFQKLYVHVSGRLCDFLLQLHQTGRRVEICCIFIVIRTEEISILESVRIEFVVAQVSLHTLHYLLGHDVLLE